ncbi:hypothetical protein RMN56_19830 [Micromonospora halotolerans]|uniref:Uncharacterized protein n=1 Tax=Micromonospora halotolerans TaxID=709879 RepID=A0ABY9ZQ38_9ACTN|nr:hypothetical protein [Micromonospora halotolerans]WNM37414.1 hypothetical protein RMN56_19830 [Micromonospora halotolerans]
MIATGGTRQMVEVGVRARAGHLSVLMTAADLVGDGRVDLYAGFW